MSRIRDTWIHDSTGAEWLLNNGGMPINLRDSAGLPWVQDANGAMPVNIEGVVPEPNGGLPVNIQDQTSSTLILPMVQELGADTLAADTVIFAYTVTVTSSAGMTIGDHFRIINALADRYYFGTILNIVGNVITVDTQIDYIYISGSEVTYSNENMNVDGSVTPIIFKLRTGAPSIPSSVDITRILIVSENNGANTLSKFGDIVGGITRGLTFRKVNSDVHNIFNVKTNADMAAIAYDWEPYTVLGAGTEGFKMRLTFAGQDKIGVALRVGATGNLQMVVQDDLTSLDSLICIVEGHVVV
jgi:hypothetical protein